MHDTIQTLIPILRLLLASVGVLASCLFTLLRARVPPPASAPTARWRRWLLTLLYAPAWSRISVMVLAGLLSIGLSMLLALLTGQPVAPVADAAVAALISQLWHALSLSRTLPTTKPMNMTGSVSAADLLGNTTYSGMDAGVAPRERTQPMRRKGDK